VVKALGLITQDEQQLSELLSLLCREAGEKLVLGLTLRSGGSVEVLLAGGGEADDMAAAVARIAVAGDPSVVFEGVEQLHEHAGCDAHEVPEFALRHRATVMQEAEQVELPGREALIIVGGAQAAHGLLAQESEEQAGAGGAFVEDALLSRYGGGAGGGHTRNIQ
jgi:hypothetical protein